MKQSAELSQKAEDIFDGETMRGLLLTAYGFSLLGERGAMAATGLLRHRGGLAIGALVSLMLGLRERRRPVVSADRMQAAA